MKINITALAITLGLSSIATLIIVAALGLSATPASAQDNGGPRFGPGPGGPGGPQFVPPIIAALDANKDGRIDASEIANASAALKTLDKNNDGELSMDEINGPRPGGERGGPNGGPGRRPPPQEQ
jgi:hypothetical protein